MSPGALHIEAVAAGLRTKRVGRTLEYVESTTSTNNEAWARVNTDAADGLAVFTEEQSAGRGRLGRTWFSPRGASLLCSVMLVDKPAELTGEKLGLVAAIAVRDAITTSTDVIPMIKWPNDLTVSGRKLGGILIESRHRRDGVRTYVIGIGINCLQHRGHLAPTLGDTATSLEIESVGAVDRSALAVALLSELDRWLAEPGGWDDDLLHREWLARAEPMGQRVRLQHAGRVYSGTVVDVDPRAALVVQLDEGGVRAFDVATTATVAPGNNNGLADPAG